MSIRRITRAFATGVGVTACAGMLTLGLAGVAGADAGVTLTAPSPNPPSGQTVTPSTPFSSGQTITISVPLSVLQGVGITVGSSLAIEECGAPGGVDPSTPVANCDGNTHQAGTVLVKSTGLTFTGYPIFALPDANLGEYGGSPVCDLNDECVLYIGENQNLASAPHIYSAGFFVNPGDGSDDGASPGDGLPEVPLAVGLPLAAAGIFGGTVLFRRRKANRAKAA